MTLRGLLRVGHSARGVASCQSHIILSHRSRRFRCAGHSFLTTSEMQESVYDLVAKQPDDGRLLTGR